LHFNFHVINGAWEGTFHNGNITVHEPYEPHSRHHDPFSSLDKVEILTDNQDRLRGEYQTVFANFDNVDYIAPTCPPLKLDFGDDEDDTIPF
jgi:hypothetical protein